MYHIKAKQKGLCVRIYFIVRACVTGIFNNVLETTLFVKNVLGTSLLCHLAFLLHAEQTTLHFLV